MANPVDIAANIIYLNVNLTVFIVICLVTAREIKEYRAAQEKSKERSKERKKLFILTMAFNVVTVSCIFGLFYFSALNLEAQLNNQVVTEYKSWKIYHSFWVMFYGKQNCLMLLILFLRLEFVFKSTPMELTPTTSRFFSTGFNFALVLFTSLPFLHIIIPEYSIWTWCASTFCFYNLAFMSTLSYLFLYKLYSTNKMFLEASFADNLSTDNQKQTEEKEKSEQLFKTFRKTANLAIMSIVITGCSCILLIVRFSFMIHSDFIDTLSKWLISIDIYANFAFITLTYKFFNWIYEKIFGKMCDVFCNSCYPKVAQSNQSNTDKIANTKKIGSNTAEAESEMTSKTGTITIITTDDTITSTTIRSNPSETVSV